MTIGNVLHSQYGYIDDYRCVCRNSTEWTKKSCFCGKVAEGTSKFLRSKSGSPESSYLSLPNLVRPAWSSSSPTVVGDTSVGTWEWSLDGPFSVFLNGQPPPKEWVSIPKQWSNLGKFWRKPLVFGNLQISNSGNYVETEYSIQPSDT